MFYLKNGKWVHANASTFQRDQRLYFVSFDITGSKNIIEKHTIKITESFYISSTAVIQQSWCNLLNFICDTYFILECSQILIGIWLTICLTEILRKFVTREELIPNFKYILSEYQLEKQS